MTTLRLDNHDARSYLRGRHNRNQKAEPINFNQFINGTAAMNLTPPAQKIIPMWRPGTQATVYLNGVPFAAKVVMYGRNWVEPEIYVRIDGIEHRMSVKHFESLMVKPEMKAGVSIQVRYCYPTAHDTVKLGTWNTMGAA